MAAVTAMFETMHSELDSITQRLCGTLQPAPILVNCISMVEDMALTYEPQLGSRILVEHPPELFVTTYLEDLLAAMREVLQNAVDASKAVKGETPPVQIRLQRDPAGRDLTISVCDRGPGLSGKAKIGLFAPGTVGWDHSEPRHKGMGLYVARRMMNSIGATFPLRLVPVVVPWFI
jgi:K+-sensing histidine kinase KdpD